MQDRVKKCTSLANEFLLHADRRTNGHKITSLQINVYSPIISMICGPNNRNIWQDFIPDWLRKNTAKHSIKRTLQHFGRYCLESSFLHLYSFHTSHEIFALCLYRALFIDVPGNNISLHFDRKLYLDSNINIFLSKYSRQRALGQFAVRTVRRTKWRKKT